MIKSTITEITVPDMKANFDSYTLTEFYYPRLFPLKAVPTPSWKAINGVQGAPVAASVVSFDSTAPRKMRPRVEGNQGNIPKLSIAREKMESELYDYYLLKQQAFATGDTTALLEWIYEDDEFCYKGIGAELEWMALRAASQGKIVVDNTNNDGGVVSEYAVDFLIPTANKSGVSVNITEANASTSKPITLFKSIVKAAKAKYINLRYAYMDQTTLDAILASDESVKYASSFILQATQLTQTPTKAQLQAYLTVNLGITIGIIDSFITLEIDSVQTQVKPWQDGVILFCESPTLGSTFHAPLAEENASFNTAAIKVKRQNVMLKKFAIEEPFKEVTIAQSMSFPVLNNAKGKYLVDTLHSSWTY